MFDKPVTINVTDVNEAPGDATLSGGSVAENSPGGTLVGRVTGVDPDAGASLRYALTDNAGGRFQIDRASGEIVVVDKNLIDYERAHSHQITVRVTDQSGLSLDKNFTIVIGDVYERIHADFNGDGRSDVLWRADSGTVAAWDSGSCAGRHVGRRAIRGDGWRRAKRQLPARLAFVQGSRNRLLRAQLKRAQDCPRRLVGHALQTCYFKLNQLCACAR